MRKMLRRLHARVGVRGWVALCLLLALGASLPSILGSQFVAQHRAAFARKRAEADVASGNLAQARIHFREALRLQPGDLAARSQLAQMELGLGNTELAFLEYQSLTEMHPEDVEAWVQLGKLMAAAGQLEAPEAVLDTAIELDPVRADARLLRGNIRLHLGRYYGALKDAQAAVQAAPGDVEAWLLLVRSAARSQGVEAGLASAKQAVGKVGEQPALKALVAGLTAEGAATDLGPAPAPPRRLRVDAQTGRGNLGEWTREHWPGRLAEVRQAFDAAVQKRDWVEAQRLIDSSASAYPNSVFVPYLEGVLELGRGNLELAESKFKAAMVIAPRLPATLAALGRIWSLRHGPRLTAQELARVGTEDAGFSTARYMAARAYIEARDPIHAEAALRAGLQLQPDSPVPSQQLTDYYFGLDRAAEALDTCRQGLERFPDNTGLQMMLAQMEAGTGQTPAAIDTYEKLTAHKPDLDFAEYKLAMLLATESGNAEAHQRFLAALEKLRGDTPSDPGLLDALGWMSFRAQDFQRARALLEAAVKGAPEQPSIRYHLALAYAEDNESVRAKEELQAALDSPLPFPERIDAVRRLREGDGPASSPRKVRVTSEPHSVPERTP
jgi:tetratricopeptide (TPR) repeat protein